MNVFRAVILGSLLLCYVGLGVEAAAGKKPQELILGKWKTELKENFGDKDISSTVTMEFLKEGKMSMVIKVGEPFNNEISAEGTYKLIDDATLETTLVLPDRKEGTAKRLKIEILTNEKLTLASEEKSKLKRLEFSRAK